MEKPDTLRTSIVKEWIRINFLSPHIQRLPKDKKILDLACGWGFSLKINKRIIGIEYDENCVRYLTKKGFNVVKGNILENLPFNNESFDIVFSHDVLEHFTVDESQRIFDVVYPVLKNGGKFINVVPNKRGYEFGFKINAGHKHYVIPHDIENWATKSNFTYMGYYNSPFPACFDYIYKHNKKITTCIKNVATQKNRCV